MKVRNGFVSNSSSSSFTCDVCGTTESGMDASPSDFDMDTCVNGHTFCNDHSTVDRTSLTPEQYRDAIRNEIKKCTWLDKEKIQADIVEMEMVPDDELEDYYNDNCGVEGVPEYLCPICNFTSLSRDDGFLYLKKKFSMGDKEILESIKVHFKTYSDFNNFLIGKG